MKARPSDAAYKLLFSSPLMVADLLKGFVPDPWLDHIDVSTLTPVPTELVDSGLTRMQADQVWRVQARNPDGEILIHIEFQSGSQRILPARMYAYSGQILLREARHQAKRHRKGWPPVLSIALYSGKRRWRASTHLAHHCRPVPATPLWVLPQHRFVMIDIHGQDPEHLAKLNDNLAALIMQFERPQKLGSDPN